LIAIGADAQATGVGATAIGAGSRATGNNSTALGSGARADRNYQVSLGNDKSPYSLPGLARSNYFINSRYQNNGEKRFVTTDNKGTLGTTSFSVDDLVETVAATGALSAALGATPSTTLLPDENVRCGMGTGFYRSQWAGSLGCAVKVNKRFFLNAGVAVTPTESVIGNPMGRLGFSLGFGGDAPTDDQKNLSQAPELLDSGKLIMQMGDGGNTNNPNQQDNLDINNDEDPSAIANTNLAKLQLEIQALRQQLIASQLNSDPADDPQEISLYLKDLKEELKSKETEEQELVAIIQQQGKQIEEQDKELEQARLEMQAQREQLEKQQKQIDFLMKNMQIKASRTGNENQQEAVASK
jgi:hypothetical protein